MEAVVARLLGWLCYIGVVRQGVEGRGFLEVRG